MIPEIGAKLTLHGVQHRYNSDRDFRFLFSQIHPLVSFTIPYAQTLSLDRFYNQRDFNARIYEY